MPTSLLFKLSPKNGHQSIFRPGEHEIRWLGLEILRLQAREGWRCDLGDEEAALVILSGHCTISIGNGERVRWEGLGARRDVFSGPTTAVYAPRRSQLEVTAESKLELAIVKAPCETDLSPMLITPDDVKEVSSGVANWRRKVRLIIPPGSSLSQRLIVGETLNPPGNWSGVPPHKHDCVTKDENLLEEFYYYKVKPPDSFALQMIYGQDDRVYTVGDNDVVLFHGGYHPTVAAPGTTVFYLWALAGERKEYKVSLEPRFGWVSQAEVVMKESRIQQMK